MSAQHQPTPDISTLLAPFDIQPRMLMGYVAGIFSTFWVNLLNGHKPCLIGHNYATSLSAEQALTFGRHIEHLCRRGGVPTARPEAGFIRLALTDGQPCLGLQQALQVAGLAPVVLAPLATMTMQTELSPLTGLCTPELSLAPAELIQRYLGKHSGAVSQGRMTAGASYDPS